VERSEVEAVCGELEVLVRRFCGGEFRREILCASQPRMSLAQF